jgi:hypothetical protein
MRKATVAVIGLLCVVAVAAFVLGLGKFAQPVSAQASRSFHVLTVTSGGVTCRDMTNNLRTDRDAWRSVYFNYMAGFITGANFVSYSAGGQNANIGFEVSHDAVFTSIEQYCGQNAAQNISEAVIRVYSQLITR